MQKNSPFYTKEGIKSSPFNYPPTGNKFEEGKNYAWMVTSGNTSSDVSILKTEIKNISQTSKTDSIDCIPPIIMCPTIIKVECLKELDQMAMNL